MEMPDTAEATPVATITNSVVATNNSIMPADATRRNRGLITTRPTITITPSAMAAFVSASRSVATTEPASPVPKMEILSQQSREAGPTRACVKSSLSGKQLDDDGG